MPSQSQRRVNVLLSNLSVKYRSTGLIALDVFPEVSVTKDSDTYRVYERNFRLEETARNDGAVSRETDFDVSTATYLLEKHALKSYVSDDAMDNYEPHSLRQDVVEDLTDKILRRLENSVSDLFATTGNWSLNVSIAAADQFNVDTTTAANPILFYDTGATEIMEQGGFAPNYGIMPRSVFVALKNNTTYIWERIKYTSIDITPQMMQGLLDIQQLLIPHVSQDSSAQGVAASITSLWGDNSFIGYKPERASIRNPSSGYTFRKSGNLVKTWRDEDRESEAIEVNMRYHARIVASLSGFLLRDTLA